MRLYFREVERLGEPPGPQTRGRVFVSNHTNALIDPILVITDAACEISPIAKSTLWSIPGLSWLLDRAGAVPIIRRQDAPDKAEHTNAAVFDRIASHLGLGGNVLIFPEGTSHSGPQLAPLRSGAARMLVAAEQHGGTPPTFQAVGLEFDHPSDFRSRCLVLWGPIRSFADVPGVGDDRIRAATAIMESDLKELLVEAATPEDRLRVARVAALLAADAGDPTLRGWSEHGRRVELASRTLRDVDPSMIARVAERVDAYYLALARAGATDAQITGASSAEASVPLPGWQRALLAPLAASGFVLYAIPYFLPRWIARSADPDARSTIKLGAALIVYPVWATGLVIGSFVVFPFPLSLLAATIAVASPFAALHWLDRWYARTREPTAGELDELRMLRVAACAAIDDARAKLPS